MEAEGSRSHSHVSNTRWRPEPGDPSDGLNNLSGICCFFLQIFVIAVTGYERKNSPQHPPPLCKALSKMHILLRKLLLHWRSSVGLTAEERNTTTDPPPWQGLNYPGKFCKERVPANAVTDLIDLHRAERGGIYCTWQYHAQALLMRGLKTANIDESCQ